MNAPQPESTAIPSVRRAAAAAPTAGGLGGLLYGSARTRALVVLGILALALVFLFGGDGWLSVLDVTLIAAIGALGLNVLSGYAGQISLGLAFFMAIGAYTAAWLGGTVDDPTAKYKLGLGLSFLIWLPAAGIAAALVGALIGPTALRLKGFYLGIVTLALVFIGIYLFKNLPTLTGGPGGRNFPAPGFGDFSFASDQTIFGFDITSNQLYFLLLLLIVAVCAIFVGNVARSRAGRAFQAVRDNETAASIMGVNLFQAKMGAFILSSFLAGISGALYAAYSTGGFANPDTWSLALSIEFVAAILIGGVASVWGSILGAAFVFALPQALNYYAILPQTASSGGLSSGDLSAIIYGVFIIVFLLFEPLGIIGLLRRLQFVFRRFDDRRKGGETTSTSASMSASSDSEFEVERTPLPRQADA